jgi:hypothetical protein
MRFMLIYKVALVPVLLVSNRRVGKGGYGTGMLQTLLRRRRVRESFDVSNLRHMRVFCQAIPIRDALRPELS